MGVPQGACLSPVLFALYVNDLPDAVGPDCALTVYADDTSFIISHPNSKDLESKCNIILNKLLDWFSKNMLYLNPSKTHYMRFHNRQKECD